MRRILPTLLLFALLATSCSKDELVQPVGTDGVSFNPKNAPVVTPPTTDLNGNLGGQQGLDGGVPKPTPEDQPDGSISDDGEDLSDSEKSRKKKR